MIGRTHARRFRPRRPGTLARVPYYICPRCKERSLDIDAREGFSTQAPACRHCGFGFLFELLDDYYPAPDTGLVVTDQNRRVLAIGRGVFELTGFPEVDLMGRDLVEALQFSDSKPSSSRANGVCAGSTSNSRSRRARVTTSRCWRTSFRPTTMTAVC